MATFAAADKPAWRRLRPPPAGWGVGVAWLVTLLSALLTGWLWAAPVSKAGCKVCVGAADMQRLEALPAHAAHAACTLVHPRS